MRIGLAHAQILSKLNTLYISGYLFCRSNYGYATKNPEFQMQ